MLNLTLIRRTALTLSLFCFAVSMAADSYHPNILKSQVVSLDVAAIERDANNGTPFELTLGGNKLTVVLLPAPVWPEEGLTVLEVGADRSVKRRTVYGNITYAGDVVGEDPEESEVRFTITGGAVEGYVLSSTGWWFIEPLSRFDPKAGPGQHLVYAAHDTDFAIDYGDDTVKSDTVTGWDPPKGPPTPKISLVMVADRQYVDSTFSYEARQAALINSVNGLYKAQIGHEFRIVISIADFGDTFLTSTNAQVLLTDLEEFIAFAGAVPPDPAATPKTLGLRGLNALQAYFAHLTTAKDLDGNTEGVAEPDGGRFALSRQQAGLTFKNTMLAAHEIGHNFSGAHEGAECDQSKRTILCPVFSSQLSVARFSDGILEPAKNNRKKIRDWIEAFRPN